MYPSAEETSGDLKKTVVMDEKVKTKQMDTAEKNALVFNTVSALFNAGHFLDTIFGMKYIPWRSPNIIKVAFAPCHKPISTNIKAVQLIRHIILSLFLETSGK